MPPKAILESPDSLRHYAGCSRMGYKKVDEIAFMNGIFINRICHS